MAENWVLVAAGSGILTLLIVLGLLLARRPRGRHRKGKSEGPQSQSLRSDAPKPGAPLRPEEPTNTHIRWTKHPEETPRPNGES